MILDTLETLLRQAQIDAKDPQSRLKIIGSLPQTRYVRALYANGEALIAGCKAVAVIVEAQEQLRAAINEILEPLPGYASCEDEIEELKEIIRKINALFGNPAPASDKPAPGVLRVVQP